VIEASSRHLLEARRHRRLVDWNDVLPRNVADAYAIQDRVASALAPVGGWKVGAGTPTSRPLCAPLPASGLIGSGSTLGPGPTGERMIEVEVALRLGRDLRPQGRLLGRDELAPAFDALLPVIEVLESRLADRAEAPWLASLGDFLGHGMLVLGEPSSTPPGDLDLTKLHASMHVDGVCAVDMTGANPCGDVWRLLAWLAVHCEERGQPLRAGQIVTTGSCTGVMRAPERGAVRATVHELGSVALSLERNDQS
jgi:2-keto-4-pentenoate hydratase